MTASTTVPLALVVPVTVVTGSVKSMVFKFPTDEECLTYRQTYVVTIRITLNTDREIASKNYNASLDIYT